MEALCKTGVKINYVIQFANQAVCLNCSVCLFSFCLSVCLKCSDFLPVFFCICLSCSLSFRLSLLSVSLFVKLSICQQVLQSVNQYDNRKFKI